MLLLMFYVLDYALKVYYSYFLHDLKVKFLGVPQKDWQLVEAHYGRGVQEYSFGLSVC